MSFPVKTELFDPELAHLAALAGALAHPARLMILQVLALHETCICGEIVDELPLSQASVSRHLKALKDAGLIRGEISGPRTCYCLDREAFAALRASMASFFDSLPELPQNPSCS